MACAMRQPERAAVGAGQHAVRVHTPHTALSSWPWPSAMGRDGPGPAWGAVRVAPRHVMMQRPGDARSPKPDPFIPMCCGPSLTAPSAPGPPPPARPQETPSTTSHGAYATELDGARGRGRGGGGVHTCCVPLCPAGGQRRPLASRLAACLRACIQAALHTRGACACRCAVPKDRGFPYALDNDHSPLAHSRPPQLLPPPPLFAACRRAAAAAGQRAGVHCRRARRLAGRAGADRAQDLTGRTGGRWETGGCVRVLVLERVCVCMCQMCVVHVSKGLVLACRACPWHVWEAGWRQPVKLSVLHCTAPCVPQAELAQKLMRRQSVAKQVLQGAC